MSEHIERTRRVLREALEESRYQKTFALHGPQIPSVDEILRMETADLKTVAVARTTWGRLAYVILCNRLSQLTAPEQSGQT